MSKRWDDPILDESLPDPVFDNSMRYKGNVPYGFSNFAEQLNGRLAMLAFATLFLKEAIAGQGILTQYGLPYDEGAQVQAGGTGVPGLVALVLALAVPSGTC